MITLLLAVAAPMAQVVGKGDPVLAFPRESAVPMTVTERSVTGRCGPWRIRIAIEPDLAIRAAVNDRPSSFDDANGATALARMTSERTEAAVVCRTGHYQVLLRDGGKVLGALHGRLK